MSIYTDTCFDALAQEVDIGHEEVISHQLAAVADAVREQFPAIPVVFGAAVLDGNDGVTVDKALVC